MSWVLVSDGRRVFRDIDLSRYSRSSILPTGTLLAELAFTATSKTRQDVILFESSTDGRSTFRMTIGAKGDLMIEHRHGPVVSYGLVKFDRPEIGDYLRITLSWDVPSRIGLLSVENLDTGARATKVLECPNPWSVEDIWSIFHKQENIQLDPGIAVFAVSDCVEPTGLRGGFASDTLIDTPIGPRQMTSLAPGDLVQTSEHGMQPVQRVISYEVPALGRFAPVHLQAPFFGMSRDLKVAPDHRLLVTGADAEYLFGSASVLVEARHLAKLAEPLRRAQSPTVRYVQLLLDAHVVLSTSGAWGESFYIGNLADDQIRLATSALSGISACDLPRHTRTATPHLHDYEAMVLLSNLSA